MELVQGENVAVTASFLLGQDPLHQLPRVAALGSVFILRLTVQTRAVQVRFRHRQLIPQRRRQIFHPLHIVRPVVQGHVSNHRAIRLRLL